MKKTIKLHLLICLLLRNSMYRSMLIKTKLKTDDCETNVEINVISEHRKGFNDRFGFKLIISRVSCNGEATEHTKKSMHDKFIIP